ncbi:unnamed protein product [Caenorhabditis angaria]|uniref:Serpentine receptor class gamma n=1 Tax=Caenorhabditis angaria TaxID=860376 RepID=A0A9P1IG14_9PELO|nr:unnamed protein product [Caenorhabditis angaria]
MQFVPQLLLYLFYIPAFIFSIIIVFVLRKYVKFGAFYQIFLVSWILDLSHCALYLWLHWVQICYPGQIYIDTGYYTAIQRLILSGYIVTCDLISIILTILTIYRIRFFETANEKKLIIVTASHTVIAIVVFLYQVTKTLELQDPISLFLAKYRTILTVIFICCNLATILIADSRIRQDFLAIFKCRGNSVFVISVWSSETT